MLKLSTIIRKSVRQMSSFIRLESPIASHKSVQVKWCLHIAFEEKVLTLQVFGCLPEFESAIDVSVRLLMHNRNWFFVVGLGLCLGRGCRQHHSNATGYQDLKQVNIVQKHDQNNVFPRHWCFIVLYWIFPVVGIVYSYMCHNLRGCFNSTPKYFWF